MQDLESRLIAIEQRNARVETDKAWETSWTRRIVLAVTTYVVIGLTLTFTNAENPWLGAIVPVIGFVLSTLSLPLIKSLWVQRASPCRRP